MVTEWLEKMLINVMITIGETLFATWFFCMALASVAIIIVWSSSELFRAIKLFVIGGV